MLNVFVRCFYVALRKMRANGTPIGGTLKTKADTQSHGNSFVSVDALSQLAWPSLGRAFLLLGPERAEDNGPKMAPAVCRLGSSAKRK